MNDKTVKNSSECPFRKGAQCTARDKVVCKCNPQAGRSFPRRCRLRIGTVLVRRQES